MLRLVSGMFVAPSRQNPPQPNLIPEMFFTPYPTSRVFTTDRTTSLIPRAEPAAVHDGGVDFGGFEINGTPRPRSVAKLGREEQTSQVSASSSQSNEHCAARESGDLVGVGGEGGERMSFFRIGS